MAFLLDRSSLGYELFFSPANRILVAPEEAERVRLQIHGAILAMTEGRATEEDHALLDTYVIPRFKDDEPLPVHRDFFIQLIERRKEEIKNLESDFFCAAFIP